MTNRIENARFWKPLCIALLVVNFYFLAYRHLASTPACVAQRMRQPGEKFDITGTIPRSGVVYGNAQLDGARTKRWFVGNFLPAESGRRFSDVELKWSVNKKGAKNEGIAYNKVAHSISILIRGKMQVEFPDSNLTLANVGDYTLWKPGVSHSWTALEDTITLAVRWPSLPHDQISSNRFT